ncbi:ATP-binding cassette domain-containing protein [Anaeromyxobacter oryzae]|uniref:ABC transporter ATP-binding protein n=1 Tax=Anaeromyxobacter oryzae TaxID=2918170 RepID=A0ABM7WQC1_9BACT|nr:ATP-binding cassette domain-containing protein [Anaeromyxobacter oryzae]BDG01668.1 ABC transporter ATP-binding protein [Anaeromyxobacter oryzae]
MGEAALVSARAVVRAAGLVKRYRGRPAVCGVDLRVHPGELHGLVGADGAGKSSLMKAIAGVLSFEGGTLDVLGERIDSEMAAERVKARIGFMPQGLGQNLYPELSVEENVDFFARLRLVPAARLAARKERLLSVTRLAPFRGRAMKHLSGGMKQKLGLACTLVHEPELLVLDEPTTGVDPVSRRDFWAILSELVRDGRLTALVSTAYLDEASRFHRVSLLHEGRCLAEGDPAALCRLVPGTVALVETERQAEALAALTPAFAQVEALGTVLRVLVEGAGPSAAIARVRAALGGIPCRVDAAEPELEDAFLALLRREDVAPEAGGPASAPRGPAVPPAVTGRHRGPEPAGSEGDAIEADRLTRDFGTFRAVDGVTFRVRPGEIFGLLGANGAGKTTVIKMLTGLLPPSAGRGRVAGVDMARSDRAVKRRIGYMSQAFSLYTDLTVAENVLLYAGIYGLSRAAARERGEEVLAMAGLSGRRDAMTGALPLGLRQRLALGCALLHRPQVVFLDEPTSGVDPVGRRRFWQILFELARRDRVAVLLTTHSMSEAERCDRLALMFAGRIVADAPPAALKREVEREAGRLLEIVADSPAAAAERLRGDGVGAPVPFGRHLHLLSRDPDSDAPRIRASLGAAGIACRAIRPVPLTMEDVFIYRVRALEDGAPQLRGSP